MLHLPDVPSVPLSSRRLNLHLDTAGVGRWDTALVEVWITRDGWTWHLYQNAPHTDSLLVALPGEGRYGLRIVVHDVNSHPSPTPRTGEAPQLWVEVDKGTSFIRTEEHSSTGRFLYSYREFDQPGEVKQAKQDGLRRPCGYIRRVEAEAAVLVEPREPVNFFMGWAR